MKNIVIYENVNRKCAAILNMFWAQSQEIKTFPIDFLIFWTHQVNWDGYISYTSFVQYISHIVCRPNCIILKLHENRCSRRTSSLDLKAAKYYISGSSFQYLATSVKYRCPALLWFASLHLTTITHCYAFLRWRGGKFSTGTWYIYLPELGYRPHNILKPTC